MRIASRPVVCFLFSVSLVTLVSFAREAHAQPADLVGVRASGMGGAFTAVADDATATWWNPAGLAGGAYFNALIEDGSHREPGSDRNAAGAPQTAWRAGTRGIAIAFPALGLSYYRLRVSEIQPQTSTEAAAAVRQDGGAVPVRLRSMVVRQLGATVGQSLGEHLVVGSTFKLVTAGAATDVQAAGTGSLDEADRLEVSGETHAGLDVGAMATFGRARLGLMIRNVKRPEFGDGADAFALRRHARAGFALSSGRRGVVGSATIAVDADLMKTSTALGDQRRVAAGAEAWTSRQSLGVRAGVSASTIGSRRTSFSGGLSAAVRKGMYVDGEATGGSDEGRRGWGVALRVTF